MLNKVAHLSGSERLCLMSAQQEPVDRQTPESSWKRQLIWYAAAAEGKLTLHMHMEQVSLRKCSFPALAAFLCSQIKKKHLHFTFSFPCVQRSLEMIFCTTVWRACDCVCCHYIIPPTGCDYVLKHTAAVCSFPLTARVDAADMTAHGWVSNKGSLHLNTTLQICLILVCKSEVAKNI